MQKHLKELRPNKFEDLIAMNALYRPGPMQYIPDFVARKHGKQAISYDLAEMEEILSETYGITVYQEQVMLLSQKLAGFTKGQADALRKGMGKKKKDIIDKLYPIFVEGCSKNGFDRQVVDKIWKDWEAFASYAFNKSHSTCYAYIAFQTAFLKAHYPAEFMASVLNHNKKDISKINFFLRECKRLNIPVLGPDVNESTTDFWVNADGKIRFGLSALKGVGEMPVQVLLDERKMGGPFKSIFDMARRLNLRAFNKKSFESMALGGAFDALGNIHRAQYFALNNKNESTIDLALRYGNAYQKQKMENQISLFGDLEESYLHEPEFPQTEEWPLIEKLEREKEVAGIYISAHPLDEYKLELNNFVTCDLAHVDYFRDQRIKVAGIVTQAQTGVNRKGIEYGRYIVEDYDGSLPLNLSAEAFRKFGNYFVPGQVLFLEGINQRGYNTDMYFFKLHDVKLLDTVGKDLTKSITVFLELDELTEKLLGDLEKIMKKHKGKHMFKVVILDEEGQHRMSFVSKGRKVHVDSELLNLLESLSIKIKIN